VGDGGEYCPHQAAQMRSADRFAGGWKYSKTNSVILLMQLDVTTFVIYIVKKSHQYINWFVCRRIKHKQKGSYLWGEMLNVYTKFFILAVIKVPGFLKNTPSLLKHNN